MPMSLPEPNRAEAIALFRLGIVGDLLARDLADGELRAELEARAAQRHRPPGAPASRTFHWKTLQSWYYAAKHGGHRALISPSRRKGFGIGLSPETRELLLQIRREHPSAAADLILEVAVQQGLVEKDEVSPSTLRRLFAAAGVSRSSATRTDRRERRRWDAGRVGALWHGDVCHIWVRSLAGVPRKLYVHGLLDDHSRFVPVLEARETEKEVDMLSVLCAALLRIPTPDVLYLDNGSCYRGETLALACARLGIRLVHAQPYDPQARGKMERFWRTLRQRCTDHLPPGASLHDVNASLLAFLDAEYHARPHAGLMGEPPTKRFHAGLGALGRARSAKELATALEVTVKRRIGNALTFSLEGRLFEVRGRHLAGKAAAVVLDPFTGTPLRVSVDGDAVDRLVGAVHARQHALVIGEPGVGKNCVVRGLRARLSPVHFRLTYIANVSLGKRDFYKQICLALGVECKLMPATLYAAIQNNLAALARERVHPVLVLDEAHLMPDSSLGTLHVLANFQWDAEPVVSIVLVGLPELGERLKLGLHRSLLTRIGHKIEIVPATAEQTAAYVHKRIEDAGARGALFAPDALGVLHELTGGVLRSVDVLADASLRVAAHQKKKLVDRGVVRAAFSLTPLA